MSGHKVSISFPEGMNSEIEAEAQRRHVSICHLLRRAWLLAHRRIEGIPAPHARLRSGRRAA